jgi:hypothetical protein
MRIGLATFMQVNFYMEIVETMSAAAADDPVRQLKAEFGVDDEFVGNMVAYLTHYDAESAPIVGGGRKSGRKGGRKSRRLQRGGGMREILQKIAAGASRVQTIIARILPQTAAASSVAATGAVASVMRAPTAMDSVLAYGIEHADAITTLTCLMAITTAYGIGNPYTKLVENAIKFVLAVTPDPWTLVSTFFQSGPSLETYWNITNIGFRGLTIGALYYMLVLGSGAGRIASGFAGRAAIATARFYGQSIGVQKARIVTYVETLIASLEARVVGGGNVVPAGIVGVAGINEAAVEAAEEAVAVAPAEVAAAAAAAGPANAVNAVAAAAAAAAGPDNAAAEVALNALVDMAQIHIANAAAEAGAIVAGGDVANSQALVHDALVVAPSNEVAENAINLLIPAVNNAMSPAGTPAHSQEVEMSQRSNNNNISHPFGFGGRRKTLKNRRNRRKQLSRRRR